jgi:hypothetical protein
MSLSDRRINRRNFFESRIRYARTYN